MRDLIFNNPAKRKLLESIMHPKIQDEVEQQLSTSSGLYQIIVIPLLTSSPLRNQIDRILLVDCDVNTQLTRIMQRDGVTSELAKKIIASQSSRNERLAIAHDVIENNSSFEQILPQVKKFHERYLRLAKK
jgi:dephospho-CoA kinase